MKTKLLVLFTLLVILLVALSVATFCFADDEITPDETTESNPVVQEEEFDFWTWAKDTWARTKEAINVSVSAVVGAIVIVAIKRFTNKGFDAIEKKTDVNKIADKTTERLLGNLGDTKLEVDIKPLMAKHYADLQAELKLDIQKRDAKQDQMNIAMLGILKSIGGFYKNSVAISDEQKQEFDEKIAEAEKLCTGYTAPVTATIELKAEAEETKETITENY